MKSAPCLYCTFMNTFFQGTLSHTKHIYVVSYTALCPGLRKYSHKKHRRSGSVCLSTHPVNEEMLTVTKMPLRVLQGRQQPVGTGSGISLFQLGHGWLLLWLFFLLSSSSQCPCEDLGQSQVPEDFPGTEATIWVCPAHISFPLSREHFGIYFTLPRLEQALSFLSLLQIKGPLLQSAPFKLHFFNFKWKFPLSLTVQNYHGKDFTVSDHTISDLIILIRLCWEPDISKSITRGPVLTPTKEKSGHLLGKRCLISISWFLFASQMALAL